MSQKAAIRRRRQMAKNYRHLAPQQRPKYKMRSADSMAKRLRRLIENEKRMKSGGK